MEDKIYVIETLTEPLKVNKIELAGFDENNYLHLLEYSGILDFNIDQEVTTPIMIKLENCDVTIEPEKKILWQNNFIFNKDAYIHKQWLCYSKNKKLKDVENNKVEFINHDLLIEMNLEENLIGQILFIKS